MKINYPLFLQDRDKWMFVIKDSVELNSHLEHIDIEDKEYIAWDMAGLPLELYLDQREIKVTTVFNESQVDKLKEAILSYAKLAGPKVPFVYHGSEGNIIELFKAVEEHIKIGRKCKIENRRTMISAILAIIFGILTLISRVPVVLPVFGLALGANALIKEKKNMDKRKTVITIAIVGIIVNGFVVLMFILRSFAK